MKPLLSQPLFAEGEHRDAMLEGMEEIGKLLVTTPHMKSCRTGLSRSTMWSWLQGFSQCGGLTSTEESDLKTELMKSVADPSQSRSHGSQANKQQQQQQPQQQLLEEDLHQPDQEKVKENLNM
eukprot:gene10976-17088_t